MDVPVVGCSAGAVPLGLPVWLAPVSPVASSSTAAFAGAPWPSVSAVAGTCSTSRITQGVGSVRGSESAVNSGPPTAMGASQQSSNSISASATENDALDRLPVHGNPKKSSLRAWLIPHLVLEFRGF